MVIDRDLSEPENPRCDMCGRTYGVLKGVLIHWPDEDFKGEVTLPNSLIKAEPFSFWHCVCRWCRGVETRRAKAAKD